jgi:DNA polymerase III epsilon subunit-like protein
MSGVSSNPTDGYSIAWHNGIGFDHALARGMGIKVKNGSGVDTYDMMRSLVPLGTKHGTTGKTIMSYNLDEVADWFGISRDGGTAHTGASDVDLGNKVFQKIMEEYGEIIKNEEAAYNQSIQDVKNNIAGKVFQATGSYVRSSTKGYRKDASGAI